MRKTVLVIGAVIGLALSLASVVQAETIESQKAFEVVMVKDFVNSECAITPTKALKTECDAFINGNSTFEKLDFSEVAFSVGESTNLANLELKQLQVPGEYRLTHEVGWRA